MTALAANLQPLAWAHGGPRTSRRAGAGTFATGKRCFLGSLIMQVDGVAEPVVSGSAMAALCNLYAGADANGGLYVSARRAAVRLQIVSAGAEIAGVTYNGTTNTYDVIVSYNNGTSTGLSLANFMRSNADINRLLRVRAQGTGASSPAAVALTAVKHIELLGASPLEYNNALGGTPLALTPHDVFHLGEWGCLPDSAATPLLNSMATIFDDCTVSSEPDALAIQVPITLIDERGLYYVDLMEAR